MRGKNKPFHEEKLFSESLQVLERKMRQANDRSEQLHQRFLAQLEIFGHDFERHLHETDQMVKTLPIAADLRACAQKAAASFRQAAANIRNQQSLRQQLQGRFVVFVYGKVKSGKSSLGNLVAQYAAHKPEFFHHAEAGCEVVADSLEELPDCSGFEVKVTEATSAIQGFRLPGLSWIDSPGLGSVTRKNGELAEQYVAAADLILFVVHGENPEREENLQEVALQARSGKRMIIVLTRSDTTEKDEIDGELVSVFRAKSPAERRTQECGVAARVAEHLGDNPRVVVDIFSVSKKIADLAHAQQSLELWQQSNIGQLLLTIRDILNRDAVQQKAKTPLEQMRASLNQLIDGRDSQYTLNQLKQALEETRRGLLLNQADFGQAFNHLIRTMRSQTITLVDELFMDTARDAKDKLAQLDQAIKEALAEQMREQLEPVIRRGAEGVRRELAVSIDPTLFTIEEQFIDVTVTRSHARTGSAWGGIFGGLAGAAGFLAGPVVGAATLAFGSWAGGKIGEKVGCANSESENVRIKAGDDSAAKLRQLRSQTEKNVMESLDRLRQDMTDTLYDASLRKITLLEQEIDRFKTIMTQLVDQGEQP